MKLTNDKIEIQVDTKGAELFSLIDLETGIEYMWQQDPKWWGKVSPVLFPNIGVTQDSVVKIEGITYPTTKHGFMRDTEMVASKVGDRLVFHYESTDENYTVYPYRFELDIIYTLENKKVVIAYQLKNLENKDMYYSLGAHPAFNFKKGDKVIYKTKEIPNRYHLEGPLVKEIQKEMIDVIEITDETFENDALIHDKVASITLVSDTRKVHVECGEFDYVGLWSMRKKGEIAPFICVEPWHGLPDMVGFKGDIKDKKGIQHIKALGEKILKFSIEIG